MFHAELTLEIPGTPVIRIPVRIMMAPAVVMAATPPIVTLMPPSLDHALIGHGLIGDAAHGHRACRRQRRGLRAASECTSQKGRGTENDELTHVFSSGRRIFPQSDNARHLGWFRLRTPALQHWRGLVIKRDLKRADRDHQAVGNLHRARRSQRARLNVSTRSMANEA